MKQCHYEEVPAATVETDDAQGVSIRWLIDEQTGARNFAMRHFDIEPGGHTPKHVHAWEHEVYILAGEGCVWGNDRENPLKPGDVIFIPGSEEHQFRNTGAEPMAMLCLIPINA